MKETSFRLCNFGGGLRYSQIGDRMLVSVLGAVAKFGLWVNSSQLPRIQVEHHLQLQVCRYGVQACNSVPCLDLESRVLLVKVYREELMRLNGGIYLNVVVVC